MSEYYFVECNLKLSCLFNYDISEKRNAFLAKSLEEYRFFVQLAENASFHFQKGDYERFDSLVGENACQIRAVKIAIIASNKLIDFASLDERLSKLRKKMEELLHPKKLAQLMSANISLKELIEKEELDILFSENEMFMIQAFVLNEAKEPQFKADLISFITRKDKSDPKQLLKFNPIISCSVTRSLVSKMRRCLAENSIEFVKQSAIVLNDTVLIEMTSDKYTVIHNNIPCIPMFWTYKVLLEMARLNSIPLIVHAKFLEKQENGYRLDHEEHLYFKPLVVNQQLAYVHMEPDESDLSKAAIIIEGVVCMDSLTESQAKRKWKEDFFRHSIVDIILAGAADHRQYPDPAIEIVTSDGEYASYKAVAKLNGFSLDNPSTFFINHVYSIQPERYFVS